MRDAAANNAPTELSAAALEAWRLSFFGDLGGKTGQLLRDSREIAVAAGESLHRIDSSQTPVLFVIVDGQLRVFTTSASGRQVTLRYLATGDAFGLPTVLAPKAMDERLHLAVQAVNDARVLRLRPALFTAFLEQHPEYHQKVYEQLTKALLDSYELLVENVFLTVRQRVARHLLDLAVREGPRLIVRAGQQEIADSIGSVREVVARAILRMRESGLIERVPDGYLVLDAAALHRIAQDDS